MAQIDNAKSFRGSYIRVTRLDAAGKLVNAADACFVSKSFIKVSFTPEYEEGEEHKQQNADGSYCLQLKLPDTLKRAAWRFHSLHPEHDVHDQGQSQPRT